MDVKLVDFGGEEYEFSSNSLITIDLYVNSMIVDGMKFDLENERYIICGG